MPEKEWPGRDETRDQLVGPRTQVLGANRMSCSRMQGNADTGHGPSIPKHCRNTHAHGLPYQPDNLAHKSGSCPLSAGPSPMLGLDNRMAKEIR